MKFLVIPEERFVPCEDGTPLDEDRILNLQQFSVDTDFLLLDDNKIMLNGTVTFNTRIEAPWSVLLVGEKLERGVWTQKVVKNMRDACYDFFNPMDIFYINMKTFQRCPYEKGVSC